MDSFTIIRGTDRALGMFTDRTKTEMFNAFENALGRYSVNTPAKQVLTEAFKEATPVSVLRFCLVCQVAQRNRQAIDPTLIRVLVNEKNQPVFWSACERMKPELQKNAAESTDVPKDTSQRFNRRVAVGKIAGGGAVVALISEVLTGGWTSDAISGRSINKIKVARVITEAAIVKIARDSTTKNRAIQVIGDLLKELSPVVAKETGIPYIPPTLPREAER